MQKNNTVLIIIIALILFLPSSSVKSETAKTWLENTDKYELLANEGFIAFECNEVAVVDKQVTEVIDTKVKCECNGTGKIRTGDNRVLPCPCVNCTCAKSTNDNTITLTIKNPQIEETQKKNTDTVQEEKSIDISQFNGRCFVFTNPEWCVPCIKLEKTTFPILEKAGFQFGEVTEAAHITKLNEKHPLFTKYGHKSIPLFIFIKDGKVVKELNGYQEAGVIADTINGLSR